MSTSLSQLRMGFTRFGELVAPRPAPGYGLRTYRRGDEDAWLELLATGDFGAWDRSRLDRMLGGERAPMSLAGAFFATYWGRLVGTMCTFVHARGDGEVAEVGWLVVHPAHRGRGLGLELSRARARIRARDGDEVRVPPHRGLAACGDHDLPPGGLRARADGSQSPGALGDAEEGARSGASRPAT